MILHPMVVALALTDLTTAILLLASSWVAVRVLLGWEPESASRAQLELERRVEGASLHARAASISYLLGTMLLALSVASVLPGLVAGAMCGTGVLQAASPLGTRALALRGLALAALAGWHLLDRLGREHPRAPLTSAAARALLLATPVVLLALFETGRAFWTLDGATPVDCCAVVYDAVRTRSAEAASPSTVSWTAWMLGAAVPLLIVALLVRFFRSRRSRQKWLRLSASLAVLTTAWVPLAAIALVRELAAYHYGVLAHDCPYCLMTARHHLVGYPLFGALMVVALEGGAAALAASTGERVPEVRRAAETRARRAGLRAAGAAIFFLVLSLWPAVAWRLENGVWMTG